MSSYSHLRGRRSANEGVMRNSVKRLLLVIFAGLALAPLPFSASAAELGLISLSAPPGKLIDIGTHRLYIHCMGRGSPAVVLNVGLGGSSLEWLMVQQGLRSRTRVCAYDRGGYGWSESGARAHTSLQNATELRLLLMRAGVEPPYVLVGHSFGGYDVQLFASRYPDSVAGLVLVDSSHSGQVQRFEAEPIGVNTAPQPGNAVLISRPSLPKNVPAELSDTVAALMSSPKALRATMDELQHFRISARQVARSAPWPDVPVIVLTRGKRVWPANKKGRLMEALWMQLQTELAKRNPRSLQIVARQSGHHIHLDQPEVVTRAVALLLDAETAPVHHKTLRDRQRAALFVAHTLVDDALITSLYTRDAAAKRVQKIAIVGSRPAKNTGHGRRRVPLDG
ncbi:MAG: alpha/beta hydrolase [Pseudomonadota bacterium]|nr:alpha/beta hydrolase [Pseudomonadota bacterium]